MWIKVQSHFHDYIMHINRKKPLYKSVFAICILAKGLSWGLATGLETAFPHCIFMMCCFSAEKLYKANVLRNWCICLFSTVGQQCFLALKNQAQFNANYNTENIGHSWNTVFQVAEAQSSDFQLLNMNE